MFERYLRKSDLSGAGLMFATEIDFDGAIDAEILSQAVRITLVHHPLMASIVDASGEVPMWRAAAVDDVFRHQRAPSLSAAFGEPIDRIDVTRSPGVCVQLTSTDDGCSRIAVYCHHICADGQGVSHFLRHICSAYAALLQGRPTVFNVDPERLGNRGDYSDARYSQIGTAEGLRNLWITIRGRTARFQELAPTVPDRALGSVIVESELDSALSAQIRNYLCERQYVLNDFSLAAGLLMLAQVDPPLRPGGYLSMLNPVDLRTWADRRLSAANRVGFAFVRRRTADWASAGELAESVTQQMCYVRQRGVGAEIIKGFGLAEQIPGCFRLVERSGRFHTTASLTCMSNLSVGRRHGLVRQDDHWKLGGAWLRRISAAAPLTPGVPLAITVVASGEKLSVTMRGCSRYFTTEMLQRLVAGWQSGCETICQSTRK
jgi:NRPS condensation-like uncharacterized protein